MGFRDLGLGFDKGFRRLRLGFSSVAVESSCFESVTSTGLT